MRRTLVEILGFVAAGAIITVGAVVLGAALTAPSMSTLAPPDLLSGSCLDEPFVPVQGAMVGTLARLCFSADDLQPRVELTGLTSSSVFSAWLTHTSGPPTTPRTPCSGVADTGATMAWARPLLIDAALADRTGRVQLIAELHEPRLPGGSEVQILVVDHGLSGFERGASRMNEIVTWEAAWVHSARAAVGDRRQPGRLVGCASFWLRGGVDSLEHH